MKTRKPENRKDFELQVWDRATIGSTSAGFKTPLIRADPFATLRLCVRPTSRSAGLKTPLNRANPLCDFAPLRETTSHTTTGNKPEINRKQPETQHIDYQQNPVKKMRTRKPENFEFETWNRATISSTFASFKTPLIRANPLCAFAPLRETYSRCNTGKNMKQPETTASAGLKTPLIRANPPLRLCAFARDLPRALRA